MAEWIDESTLPVYSPRHLVVANLVDGAVCSGRYSPLNESVGVVDEDLDPHRYSPAHQERTVLPRPSVRLRRQGSTTRLRLLPRRTSERLPMHRKQRASQ